MNISLQREQRWHNTAYIDALTGMNNRMAYIEEINEIERKLDDYQKIHVIMIDLDNFKNINDTLGHYVGDITLQKVAEYLNGVFKEESYTLFRIGGDEFAIVALDVTEEQLLENINYILDEKGQEDLGCTLSVGYSVVSPNQNNSMENAFIRADRAMYKMKADKKTGVTI